MREPFTDEEREKRRRKLKKEYLQDKGVKPKELTLTEITEAIVWGGISMFLVIVVVGGLFGLMFVLGLGLM